MHHKNLLLGSNPTLPHSQFSHLFGCLIMSNFSCNSCAEQIPAQNPRFRCQICPNYDSCANCNALGRTSGSHSMQHQAVLFRASSLSSGAIISAFGSMQGIENYGQPFPNRPLFQQQNTYGQNQPYGLQPVNGPPRTWTPLYHYDNTPAPCFMTMMQQFFVYLD